MDVAEKEIVKYGPRKALHHRPEKAQSKDWLSGSVRWFDRERRFGFLIPDDGSEDVFLYWRELQKHGVSEKEVTPDRRVKFTTRLPDKPGRCTYQVDDIVLADS